MHLIFKRIFFLILTIINEKIFIYNEFFKFVLNDLK